MFLRRIALATSIVLFLVGSLAPTLQVRDASVGARAPLRVPTGGILPAGGLPGTVPDAGPSASSGFPDPNVQGASPSTVVRSSQSAQMDLLASLRGTSLTSGELSDRMAAFYRASGFDLATKDDIRTMDANSTLTFTYSVGDADHDGTGDLVLNSYCVDIDSCQKLVNGGIPQPQVPPSQASTAGYDWCNYDYGHWPGSRPQGFTPRGLGFAIKNRLYGVSGANGSLLWELNMSGLAWNLTDAHVPTVPQDPTQPEGLVFDDPRVGFVAHHANLLCPVDFVVGTLPNATGPADLLVYRYVIDNTCNIPQLPPDTPYFAEFPVGTTVNGVLTFPHCDFIILHELRALNPTTGHTRWTRYDVGFVTASHDYTTYCISVVIACISGNPTTRLFVIKAVDLTVNPLIQVPQKAGARLLRVDEKPSLFLEGVGFDMVTSTPTLAGPGNADDYDVLDAYMPHEWTARVDFGSGKDLWRNDNAFTPQPGLSVIPKAYMVAPLATGVFSPPLYPKATYLPTLPNDVPFASDHYWGYVPCCFDQTGDGVPDLAFITFEWSSTPTTNTNGPRDLASRLVVFDGASGQEVWSQVIEPGTKRYLHTELNEGNVCAVGPYPFYETHRAPTVFCIFYAFQPYLELLGDANGDGKDDLLVHLVYFDVNYKHVVSVRSGADGKELWNRAFTRDVTTLVLGDADRDGGNDFMTFEWQDWEFPLDTVYHNTNVSVMPFTVVDGATGATIWKAETRTFNAPLDLQAMFASFKVSGIPDVNHDGVGDVPVDDPLFLPDLEMVHRETYLSGADGKDLWHFADVGTFAFVQLAGDVTGDGVDDVALLQGDVVDLWLTVYDGHNGTAAWSRRVLTPRNDDYLFALPYLRFHQIHVNGVPGDRLIYNFQFEVLAFGSFKLTDSIVPQIVSTGANGTFLWAYPGFDGDLIHAMLPGPTTAVRDYERMLQEAAKPTGPLVEAKHVVTTVGPTVALYAVGVGAAVPIARFAPWRRWRK